MGKNNETTTKFKADISNLKAGIRQANSLIRSANAEFKNATAGMDNWSKSSEGLEAKITQLDKTFSAQEEVVKKLKQQYQLVCQQEGENSASAQQLADKINNAEAKLKNTESQLAKYKDALIEAKSPTTNLTTDIEAQSRELKQLKDKYTDVIIKEDENSESAKELAGKISSLSGELKGNKEKLQDAKNKADELDQSLDNAGDAAEKSAQKSKDAANGGFTVMKGTLSNLASDAIKDVVDGLKEIATESEAAYSSFQALTGIDAQDISKYKDGIESLYNKGIGDGLDDISQAMAIVKQSIGEIDPNKLNDVTENAIVLRDTFGFDIMETMRAVNMLMQQFDITADEAFNLIIQGAQKGLNKNGDLLDTINEYSVHYKQAGYAAEDFFNSLENGAAAGTFSIDKLGDATKEFYIRVKDNSSTTTEALSQLGYSVGETAESEEKRREEIKKTEDEIEKLEKNLKYAKLEQEKFNDKTSKLTKIKNADKIKEYSQSLAKAKYELKLLNSQTSVGGKSIEDLQKKFAAGGDTAQSATKEVLEALFGMDDQVKQNQIGVALFGSMWEDLGVDGVKALTNVRGDIQKTEDSMKKIKDIKYNDVSVEFESLGRTIKTEMLEPLLEKALPIAKDGMKWIEDQALPKVKDVIKWIEDHGDVVNTTLDTLGTIIVTKFAYSTVKNIASGVGNFFVSLKEFDGDAIGTAISLVAGIATAAYDVYKNSMDAKYGISKMKEQAAKSRSDFDEFKKSVENVAGQADAAATNEERLKDRLLELVDPMGKVKDGHEKEAQVLADELNEELGTNVKIRDGEIQDLDKTIKLIDDLIAKKRAEAMLSGYKDTYTKALSEQSKKYAEYQAQKKKVESLEAGRKKGEVDNEDYQEAVKELEALKNDYETYTSTIELYENAMTANANKNYKEMSVCLDGIAGNIKTASAVSVLSLEAQLAKSKHTYEQLIKDAEDGEAGITQVQIDAAYDRYLLSAQEYDKGIALAKEKGSKEIEQYGLSIQAQTPLAEKAAKNVTDTTTKELSKGTKKAGSAGKGKGKEYVGGMNSEKENAKKAGGGLVKSSYDGLVEFFAKYKFSDVAMNAVRGYLETLENPKKLGDVAVAAAGLGVTTLTAIEKSLDIRSPSHKMAKEADYTISGYVNELLNKRFEVAKAARSIAKAVLDEFDKDIDFRGSLGFDLESLDNIKRSIQSNPTQTTSETTYPHAQPKGDIINNYTQNNYSPKPLNDAEIYRQTKNALAYVKNKGRW